MTDVTPPSSVAPALLRWYGEHGRTLPWRGLSDPYAIWVSEIILQQTRVETGLKHFAPFLARFPTVQALAAASEDDVLAAWSGLGFYRRARNLHRAARLIVDEHGGELPRDPEALGALPGVGRYTVGAILSAAHNDRLPILDGNVIRVLSRVFLVEGAPDKAATKRRLWGLAEDVLPADRPGDFNQALMDLGATVCSPTGPRCGGCPLRDRCGAFAEGRADDLPTPGRKSKVVFELRVSLLVADGDRFLVRQRPDEGLLPRLWELPAVVVGSEEGADRAAQALAAEHGAGPARLAGRSEHRFSHRHWTTFVYRAEGPLGPGRWVTREELNSMGLPTVSRKSIDLALGA